ncbi:Fur family transcriptional regulator [Collinsella vaginalis]|uniref:Fur family transcriptional regulator n=1 Tax=Collinsella vaginalis TaxID=1870987 RepID=UPI000A271E66|nr:transcriptional repressor [Collinsella vaginalis]
MARGAYETRQKQSIIAVMAAHDDAFLSVDAVCELLHGHGVEVGRTTVYRTLERLVAEDRMLKVAEVRGGAAQYRIAPEQAPADTEGQLRCDSCGRVLPLTCESLGAFSEHVLQEHGFAINSAASVLHGTCADCLSAANPPASKS